MPGIVARTPKEQPKSHEPVDSAGDVARKVMADVTGSAPDRRVKDTRHLTCAMAFAASCAMTIPAQADDIDVYQAQIAARKKANVVFVLDYSGSMGVSVSDGNGGTARRIDLLRDAMKQVLTDPANTSRMRAGIGSIYDGTASGVRWPVSDLDADAHDIDPDIPQGQFKAYEVMLKQLDRRDVRGDTRTVNALVEAAAYFRGDPVSNDGSDPRYSYRFEPDRWDVAQERYLGGREASPIAASYTPLPSDRDPNTAYWRDAFIAGDYGYCTDYSMDGGSNGCAGLTTYNCRTSDGHSWEAGEGTEAGSVGANMTCQYDYPDHWHGANYNSPIGGQCETNAIVLISDGRPDKYRDIPALRNVIGMDPSECEDLSQTVFADVTGAEAEDAEGECGPEVVRALAENPQIPSIGDSTVRTFTVGFGVDGPGQNYLDALAKAANGGQPGGSFNANDGAELITAIKAAIDGALGGSESFVELAVDVDKASFSNNNRAYFNLFTPNSNRGWSGNLKGYYIDSQTFTDVEGNVAIVTGDDPDTTAVETGTQFASNARSFWSDAPDGNTVEAGGASEQLALGNRNLYTFLGDEANIGESGVELAFADAHVLDSSNSALDQARMGVAEAAGDAALDWLQTAPMGDPLHSKSVSINYGNQQVVYVMTNQGLLHAIDATDPAAVGSDNTAGNTAGGGELFAFMPARLLPNLAQLHSNTPGTDHIYGLDGATTRWHDDINNDGIVNGNDTVMLVVGMRRGGEAYYALDVTSPTNPILKWVIDSSQAGFSELAQSWSRAALVTVQRDTGEDRVLMFGGGYDGALDNESGSTPSRGNAIFVVDRKGDLIRKFKGPDMQYSFAADLTVIDSDSDGLADRIYAADLGSNVWRIDFDNIDSTNNMQITKLASLAGNGYQPFFYAPSVALTRSASGDHLSVSLGSGDRTSPLDATSTNAFFVVRDSHIEKGVPSGPVTTIEADDLFDATNADVPVNEAGAESGWLVRLATGEKSMSRVVSFEGQLLATTFAPEENPTDACSFGSTRRFYRMDLGNAAPMMEQEGNGPSVESSRTRWRVLDGGGIPSAPVVLFPKGSSTVQIVVDRERVDSIEQQLSRVYWHAK